jgi:integrase
MIERFLIKRNEVSSITANKELQYLRALFNYGLKRKLINESPFIGIDFFPIEKKKKYIPSKEDVFKVISAADPDTQQYLWTILLTAGRINEINQMTWKDIDFENRYVTLWTRKRKNGNLEPRDVPMVQKLYDIMKFRYEKRNPDLNWIFWHTYWSRKEQRKKEGPYDDRKK